MDDYWYEQLKATGLLDKIQKLYCSEEADKVREKYKLPDSVHSAATERTRQLMLSEAGALLFTIVEKGGPKEDLDKALRYILVCMDLHKCRLFYGKFEKEEKIRELRKKYTET